MILYIIRNPETEELNDTIRHQLGGSYIRLSDGVTHYEIKGTNAEKRVVLIHGGTIPFWMWDDQSDALHHAGFQVLRYDMYGRGYSDRPYITYNKLTYQRQLLELVNNLGWQDHFDLVGHSFGGAVAINFTAAFPNRVRKLVLISPVMKNYPVPPAFRPFLIGEILLRFSGINKMKKRIKQWLTDHPRKEEMMTLFVKQIVFKGFQRSFLSMIRHDSFDDYTSVYQTVGHQKRESLLIWGVQDTEVKKEIIEDIQVCIPHIQLAYIENAGHGIVFQTPQEIIQIITRFLS